MIETDRPALAFGHTRQDEARELDPLGDHAPLIVTLGLDPVAQARFDRLRSANFPPERNLLSAHLTLFHHLPGVEIASVQRNLQAACAGRPQFALSVTGLRFLGRGVAFALSAPELLEVRAGLAHKWAAWLGPQDRQGFRPHVTIQNKVEPAQARRLLARLEAEFTPWMAEAVALQLWRYRGGPWEPAGAYTFG